MDMEQITCKLGQIIRNLSENYRLLAKIVQTMPSDAVS